MGAQKEVRDRGEAMQKETGNALEILRGAMQLEREGRDFYLKAAEATRDEKARETFTILADDEEKHYNLVKRQHDALSMDNRWIDLPEVRRVRIDLDRPLFPKGKEALERVVTPRSSDLDALLFGLDIENRSYDLYRRAALETRGTPGRAMFEFLAAQERGHFDILMMRYEYLAGPVGWQA